MLTQQRSSVVTQIYSIRVHHGDDLRDRQDMLQQLLGSAHLEDQFLPELAGNLVLGHKEVNQT